MEVFFFIGIVISFLLALLVFSKKNKHIADRIFGAWQFVLLIHFTLLYIRFSGIYETIPMLLGMDTPLVFLHMPLIFFYTAAVVGIPLSAKKQVVHLIPFALFLVLSVLSFVFYTQEDKLLLYNEQLNQEYTIVDILFIVQVVFYCTTLFKMLNRYSLKIQDEFSNIDSINLKWLKRIIVGATIAFSINAVLVFLFQRFGVLSLELIGKLTVLVVCGFQVYLGYYGLKYTAIFSENPIMVKDAKVKYDKTGMEAAITKEKFKELLLFMEKEKPFLNAELTLHQLANEFGVSYNHLSQIINENANKNFYAFINAYRLEEAIRLLQDEGSAKYTLLAIAYEAGFRSKSVFNTLFKQEKGVTPSEFRKGL